MKNYFSAVNILSQSNRENCIKAMRRIPSIKMESITNDRKAAVLVPLCNVQGEMSLLYTLRSMNLPSHKGQVSFPGGKYDLTDKSLTETALRETEEELGIPREKVEIWGEVNSYPSKNFELAVTPVIGYIRDYDNIIIKTNPSEVEELFTVPIEKLADPHYFAFNNFKNGWTLPVFMAGPHKIWGLTAIITHLFLSCLLPKDAYSMQFQHLDFSSYVPKPKL